MFQFSTIVERFMYFQFRTNNFLVIPMSPHTGSLLLFAICHRKQLYQRKKERKKDRKKDKNRKKEQTIHKVRIFL